MINIAKHLALLGCKAQDRITGFKGVVDSVSFDLYGCIQVTLRPPADKDGKMLDGAWFDISRLAVLDGCPVIDVPDFDFGPVAEGRHGCAEKPPMDR